MGTCEPALFLGHMCVCSCFEVTLGGEIMVIFSNFFSSVPFRFVSVSLLQEDSGSDPGSIYQARGPSNGFSMTVASKAVSNEATIRRHGKILR